ncbi:MAG: hypothetical protein ACOY4O_16830 [Pseudomonadota bacterium]
MARLTAQKNWRPLVATLIAAIVLVSAMLNTSSASAKPTLTHAVTFEQVMSNLDEAGLIDASSAEQHCCCTASLPALNDRASCFWQVSQKQPDDRPVSFPRDLSRRVILPPPKS